MPSSSGADCEDWISRLLQQGPHELSLDALGVSTLQGTTFHTLSIGLNETCTSYHSCEIATKST